MMNLTRLSAPVMPAVPAPTVTMSAKTKADSVGGAVIVIRASVVCVIVIWTAVITSVVVSPPVATVAAVAAVASVVSTPVAAAVTTAMSTPVTTAVTATRFGGACNDQRDSSDPSHCEHSIYIHNRACRRQSRVTGGVPLDCRSLFALFDGWLHRLFNLIRPDTFSWLGN